MFKQLQKHNRQEGFTIIEVLIVLAIAGLIMVVVFLAVPNLQRSQRNNARNSDASNQLQEGSSYVANANGQMPPACGPYTYDPSSGSWGTVAATCSWLTDYKPQQLLTVQSEAYAAGLTPDKSHAYLVTGAVCSGTSYTNTGATTRDYVIFYGLEGSTTTKCTQGS